MPRDEIRARGYGAGQGLSDRAPVGTKASLYEITGRMILSSRCLCIPGKTIYWKYLIMR